MPVSNTPLPNWQTATELPLTDAENDWLFNQESLTHRLSQLSHDQFSVQPLAQGWQSLRQDECLALEIAEHSEGWVREVYLCAAGVPWVFARSVAARQALNEAQLDLSSLGSRSLGELLFQNSAFNRGPLLACRYPTQWLPIAQQHNLLWARRSSFNQGALSVLVAEVFLPAFWQALEHA